MADDVVRTGEYGADNELVAVATRNLKVWHTPTGIYGDFVDATDLLIKAKMAGLSYRLRPREVPLSDNGMAIEGYAEKFDIIRSPLVDLNIPTERLLGTVSKGYEFVQPFELAEIFNPISKTWLPETGGLLANGGGLWMLFAIPEGDYLVGGNPEEAHKSYLLVNNDYTGKRGLTFKAVDVRVVCANTLAIALTEEKGQTISIAHDANVALKARFVTQLQAVANRKLTQVRAETEMMFTRKVSEEEVRALFEAALPLPKAIAKRPDGFFIDAVNSPDMQYVDASLVSAAREVATAKQATLINDVARRNERIEIMNRNLRNLNSDFPYLKDTLYGAMNAVTAMTTHLEDGTRGDRAGQLADPNSWRNTANDKARAYALKLMA